MPLQDREDYAVLSGPEFQLRPEWIEPLERIAQLDVSPRERYPWTAAEPIAAVYGPIVDELAAAKLVQFWDLPDGRAVALTPYAAYKLRVSLSERWDFEEEPMRDLNGRPILQDGKPLFETTASETPFFEASERATRRRELKTPKYGEIVPVHQLRDFDLASEKSAPFLDELTEEPMKLLGAIVGHMKAKNARPKKRRKKAKR